MMVLPYRYKTGQIRILFKKPQACAKETEDFPHLRLHWGAAAEVSPGEACRSKAQSTSEVGTNQRLQLQLPGCN